VLAIWAGRREAMTPEVVADFTASKQYGIERLDEIADAASVKLEMPPKTLERYLRESIDFSLDAENLAGLELYFKLCAEAKLIPRVRPLEFIGSPANAAARHGA
jgi:predicted solute-binding protein